MAEDAHSSFLLGPIKEIVTQVNPELSITKQAAEFVNTKLDLVLYFFLNAVSKCDQEQKVGFGQMEGMARATLQPTMAQWAIDEAKSGLKAFQEADPGSERFQETGLVFPCHEFERLLKERHPKIEPEAVIFLAAALEYICADLLQASGNRCLAGGKGDVIGLTDVVQTMTEDEELSKLFFVVSSDSDNGFMRRQSTAALKRGASLLVTPSKRKNSFKLDSKPFPTLDAVLPSSNIAKSEQGIDEIKAWEPPPSWNVPNITTSSSITQVLDGQQPSAESQYAAIYGDARPLSFSISAENLQKMNLKGESIFAKMKETTLDVPAPMGRKDPRRRLSTQFNSMDELGKGLSTLSNPGSVSEEAAMRNPSRNLRLSTYVGDGMVVKVTLPDNLKTTVEVAKDMTCGELLRYVVQKRCMKFDEYVIKTLPDGDKGGEELDITTLVGDLKSPDVFICTRAMHNNSRKVDNASVPVEDSPTLYLSEGGKDVLVMEVKNGRAQVIAGTPEKLVERMADENRQDSRFVDCVLLTHRFFMKPLQLFDQLVLRYLIQPPANPTPEDMEYFEEWQKPIQRKVINVVRWWVENYWQDFNNHVALLGSLLEFGEMIKAAGFDSEAELLEASMLAQLQTYRNLRSLPTTSPAKESVFLTLQPNDVATQLNLWNFELFRNIQPVEYVNNVLTKEADLFPNLDLFIKRFELESFWVATEVCMERDLRRRVMILESFIRTAKFCRDSRNYFSTFSIVGGLNLSCVQRLKTTWANIPARTMEVFHSLEELMSPYQNMKNYRDKMLASHPPIIPVLPVYLKDLLFTHDGNKTFVNKLVNLEKFKMIANQVRQITALSSVPYENEDPKRGKEAREYIKNPIVIPDLMKLSQMCNDHNQ